MSLRPRQLAHVGRVPARGLVFDPELLTEAEARRRALALLRPGALLRRARGRYVLLFATPVWWRAPRAPGALLVDVKGRLSSCPLEADELELLPQRGALVFVEGGEAKVYDLDALEVVDPARWLDLSGYAEVEVRSLGAPPPPPEPPPPPPSPRLRDHLLELPEARPEVEVLQAQLRGEPAKGWPGGGERREGFFARLRRRGASDEGAAGARPARRGLFARLFGSRAEAATFGEGARPTRRGLLARLFGGRPAGEAAARGAPRPRRPGLLARLLGSTGSTSADAPASAAQPGLLFGLAAWLGRWLGPAPAPSPDPQPPAPAPPRPPSRLGAALRDLWTRFAFRSRLAQTFGRRQARYLRDLLEGLEDGDLDEALRRAIPLGGDADSPGHVSFGVPRPRAGLDLNLGPRASGGGALLVGDALFDLLRQRYRRAFDRLVRAERYDEAAFVLADLLGEADEAVSFLEQHGRLELAAKLAEARALPPPRIVRQWLLAGEPGRAVAVAKRHDAFAAAVAMMAGPEPAAAAQLRLLWGDALAERGDFAGAVDAVWPAEQARPLARRWIELALEVGGAPAAKCLARALQLMPERFDEWRAFAEAWWAEPAPDAVWTRAALAAELTGATWSAGVARIAVGTARALARDASDGAPVAPELLRKLVEVSRDPLLRADWPGAASRRATFVQRDDVLRLEVPATDAGTLPVFDAVPLARGRTLLALGEAGVRLVTRDGRTVRHFGEPAHALVISEHGHRALCVARRGRRSRIARIDLVHQRATPWCELELGAFAETFDGWSWHAAVGGALVTLDPGEARAVELWRNRDCHPSGISWRTGRLVVAHDTGDGHEVWSFEITRRVLSARTPAPTPQDLDAFVVGAPSPEGALPYFGTHVRTRGEDDDVTVQRAAALGTLGVSCVRHSVDLPPASAPLAVHQVGDHTGLVTREVDAAAARLIRVSDSVEQLRVRLVGAERAGLRLHAGHLAVFDDRGRVLVFDLEAGRLMRSLRIHPDLRG